MRKILNTWKKKEASALSLLPWQRTTKSSTKLFCLQGLSGGHLVSAATQRGVRFKAALACSGPWPAVSMSEHGDSTVSLGTCFNDTYTFPSKHSKLARECNFSKNFSKITGWSEIKLKLYCCSVFLQRWKSL